MIYIDKESSVPLYLQLYQELKRELAAGNFKENPLPPIRVLSKELSISKNTINQAYQQLLAEGYIYSVPGSGYYCSDFTVDLCSDPFPAPPDIPPCPTGYAVPKYIFQYGNLDNSLFPWPVWKKCLRSAIHIEESGKLLEYQDRQGYFPLRQQLASILQTRRGVNCTPEQIIICSGIQDSISILTTLLPPTCYQLGVEDPGYDGAKNTFQRHGYPMYPLPVDEKGLIIDRLANSRVNLIYVTPSHQFPLGGILPITRRTQLLSLIHRRNGFIIEDDYDSEFQYGLAAPIPSLQSMDQFDQVIYLGGFSKSFSPTIRMSYMILPKQLLPIFYQKFANYKSPVAGLIQYALYNFILQGDYVRHLRKLCSKSEKKYYAVINLLHTQNYIQPISISSGLYLLVRINSDLTHEQVLEFLEDHSIRLFPTMHYWLDKTQYDPSLFLLGFASMSLQEVTEGTMHLIDVVTHSDHFYPDVFV